MCARSRDQLSAMEAYKGKCARKKKSFPGGDAQTEKMVQKTPGYNFKTSVLFCAFALFVFRFYGLYKHQSYKLMDIFIKLTTNFIES